MPTITTSRFPTDVSALAEGGPVHQTIINTGGTGAEQRCGVSGLHPLRRYTMNINPLPASLGAQVFTFFESMQGSNKSFRFQDPFDYSVTNGPIGSIGGGAYQLVKTYRLFGIDYYRPIIKPVVSSLSFTGGSGYTLDPETGRITGGTPPSGWSGEFDVEARVEGDVMSILFGAGSVGSVNIQIQEVFDTILPEIAGQPVLPAVLNNAGTTLTTIPMEIDLETEYQRKTLIVGENRIEDRFADWSTTNAVLSGNWLLNGLTQVGDLLSLFLLARGRVSRFYFSSFGSCRFGSDTLTLKRAKSTGGTIATYYAGLSLVRYSPSTAYPY